MYTPLKLDHVPHVSLHRLECGHALEALAHLEIVQRHVHGIPRRTSLEHTASASINTRRRQDRRQDIAPWISQQGFPDHDAVRARVGHVVRDVRKRPYVPVADDGDADRLLEVPYGVEIGCTLASPFGRYVARMQRDPRRTRMFEHATQVRRLGSRTQADLGGRRDGERVRHRRDCCQTRERSR